jgi:hypothetical protein
MMAPAKKREKMVEGDAGMRGSVEIDLPFERLRVTKKFPEKILTAQKNLYTRSPTKQNYSQLPETRTKTHTPHYCPKRVPEFLSAFISTDREF